MKTEDKTAQDLHLAANGIRMSYEDSGNGAIPIVFIHGFPFDKTSWQPQIQFFKQVCRTIAYDMRGFGASTTGDKELSMSLLADDLICLLDALKIPKAIVCGFSMGGYVLLNAVNRYPERFRAIVLADTQCIADSPEAKEKRALAIQKIKDGGLNDYAKAFIGNVFCRETLDNSPDVAQPIEKVILTTPEQTIIQALTAMAGREEMCAALEKVDIPTLILCGEEDKVTPTAQAEKMHAAVKNSRYFAIPNAGHMSNLEQPKVFNRHLNQFISSLQ